MLYKREYIENNKKLKEENKQLKDTIRKVIKYIRSNEWGIDYEHSNCRTHLLEILEGRDKE